MKSLLVSFTFAILATQALAQGPHHATSPYAQEAGREIKSLSETDVDELTRGGGWGFAKAAELNDYPGPSHVLQMKDRLGLRDDQLREVQKAFDLMQARAWRRAGPSSKPSGRSTTHSGIGPLRNPCFKT